MVETNYSPLLQFLCTVTLARPLKANIVLPVCVLLITLPLILIHYLLSFSQVCAYFLILVSYAICSSVIIFGQLSSLLLN